MKAKTIRAVLRKKIDELLDTVEDEELRARMAKSIVVTGGCIASMLLREPVNDFDIYFKDHKTTLDVARYYIKRFSPKNRAGIPCRIFVADEFGKDITETIGGERVKIVIKSAGIASEGGTTKEYQYFEALPDGEAAGYVGEIIQDPGDIQEKYEQTEAVALATEDDGKPKYRPVFMSTNAITLSHKLQIVLRFYGEPDKIHENYDFAHCTNYWTSWDGELVLRPAALEALLTRELRYVGSKYPICSIIRLRKFIARGWSINAGQILKMVMQVSELDLTSIAVLEDQLTGVDVAYFMELVVRLKDKDPEKVNHAYLVEIINRMF